MTIEAGRLWAAIADVSADEPATILSTQLSTSGVSEAKSLEDAVYATAGLLDDYDDAPVFISGDRHFTLMPEGMTDEQCESTFGSMWPDYDGRLTICRGALPGVDMVFGTDAEQSAFLQRCFYNLRIEHRLSVIGRAVLTDRPDISVTALAHDGTTDVIVGSGQQLLIANTYDTRTAADAAYFVLAACSYTGQTPSDLTVSVGGLPEQALRLQHVLRPYVTAVIPGIVSLNPTQLCV